MDGWEFRTSVLGALVVATCRFFFVLLIFVMIHSVWTWISKVRNPN
jgi:hypothetical protein